MSILLSFASNNFPRYLVPLLAGAAVLPATVPAVAAPEQIAAGSDEEDDAADEERQPAEVPSLDCLATTVCRLKEKVRWGRPAWKEPFCRKIAGAILDASAKYDVAPMLILAVALGESDLDDKAANVVRRGGRLYAKDTGLMGIRCVLDRGRCKNGHVRGMSWRYVADPVNNIHLGARELALWRKGGIGLGVVRKRLRVRTASGALVTRHKYVHCKHDNHAYWAHYNHGPLYISRGWPRHYPHRVAVLYRALARAMNLETPELERLPRITIRDRGQRPRSIDRPVEPRFRKLCSQIREIGGQCDRTEVATHDDAAGDGQRGGRRLN